MDPKQPLANDESLEAFVTSIADQIDSSPFDSILIVRGWKKRRKKTMKKAINVSFVSSHPNSYFYFSSTIL